jgi:MYXO-CTERM domain-containing protein
LRGLFDFGAVRAWPRAPRAVYTGSVSSAITSGETDSGDDSVVALVYSADGAPRCTGSVIAPTVVLTAAHCVDKGQPEAVLGSGARVPVADAFMHPTYDPHTFADDLAVVRLAAPIAAPALPLAHLADGDEGMTVRVVGFGVVAGGGASVTTGEKREGTSKLAELGTHTLRLEAEPSQPCLGDSGGPVFLMGTDGRQYIVGVTSHGDFACATEAYAVRVGAYDEFIRPYVAVAEPNKGGCSIGTSREAPVAWLGLVFVFARRRRRRRARE